uniref:Ig-like domain-containing protein n=1 Tax=Sparus aurata TaxID=8175 RepID=A0A671Y0H6_SPAAU
LSHIYNNFVVVQGILTPVASCFHIQWYKQSAGDLLKLIVTRQKSTQPEYAPEFPASRFQVNSNDNFSNLTILRTRQEDEGMYHCAVSEWIIKTVWSGTYLLLKGNLVTLQCSVLSDSETKTCPGDHSVFWFRVGSDKSHPNILYTDGNRRDECEDRSDTQKSCVYHFSKKVSSSDAGTYYCAVATCGEILFGNGAKVETGMILNSVLEVIYKHVDDMIIDAFFSLLSRLSKNDGDDLNYAALHLSGRGATAGRKKKEEETEESVYSQVKR